MSVLWNRDGTPELKLTANLSTRHHEPRADLEVEMDAHEKLRLFYVAATRARDHLVLSCHHKPGEVASYAQLVWEFAGDRDDGSIRRTSTVAESSSPRRPRRCLSKPATAQPEPSSGHRRPAIRPASPSRTVTPRLTPRRPWAPAAVEVGSAGATPMAARP